MQKSRPPKPLLLIFYAADLYNCANNIIVQKVLYGFMSLLFLFILFISKLEWKISTVYLRYICQHKSVCEKAYVC